MYCFILAVIMSVFSSPVGSPGWPDLDQTYQMSLSDDLKEDASHDLLERVDIHEGLVSLNSCSGRETELQWCHTQSFINSLETQTQQSPQVEQDSTEQGVQCKSCHVSNDATPKYINTETNPNLQLHPGVNVLMMLMILMVWYMLLSTFRTLMLQCLQNGNTMTISWRSTRSFIFPVNTYLMDLWPMLWVAKLKPICFSFGVDLMVRISTIISSLMMTKCMILTMLWNSYSCIVNLYVTLELARYKFCQVSQCENEMTNAFYHHIQKLHVQCQFSDDEEHLVDAISYGTKVQKAREKLLQMPKHLTLHDCLKICHHYESLQNHLNVVKLTDKPVESITKCHFNRGGKQSAGTKKSGRFRSHTTDKPLNSANNTTQCSNCSTTHAKNQCPAYHVTCFKCNRVAHFASVCRSSSSSTQNKRQFNRFCGRGRTPQGRGFTPRRQVSEATEVSETKTNDKSDLDIIRLMEAYRLSNTSP